MRTVIILLCMLIPNLSWAAAYTSSGSGLWSDPAVWGGGGFPGVGDSAVITAGHLVTLDGNAAVGTSPASTFTYDLDINGTLYWPTSPGGDWVFTAYSSVRVGATGTIIIGLAPTGFDCAHTGIWEFATAVAVQKYTLFLNGGSLQVYGCENFDTSSGSVHRARIASCAPDCTAGAGKTITLDRDVNWNASSGWAGDRILIGIGGSDTTAPAVGDDPEEITSWTAPAANQIAAVTLTENHQVGDLVVNASRNFIFRSDSTTVHSRIYSTAANDLFDMNWVMLDEMGDTTSTSAAITFNSTSFTLGTLNYVAVLNCEDGAAVACFYLTMKDWTKIEGLVAFDYRAGYGVRVGTTLDVVQNTIKDITAFEGPNGLGQGYASSGSQKNILLDGLWSSHGLYGVGSSTSYLSITNSIIHGTTGDCLRTSSPAGYTKTMKAALTNNEIRNCAASGWLLGNVSAHLSGNDFDLCGDHCLNITPSLVVSTVFSDNNTYDNCNTDNSIIQGALYVNALSFFYHGNNEQFGQTNPNFRSNILWAAPIYTTASGYARGVCNECLLATPTNAVSCASMPVDGIYLYGCASGWSYVGFVPDESYFTLHNKDGVEYDNYGWGPGGAMVSRDTVTNYTTSNIKMKITPTATNSYNYVTAGSFYVAAGTAVTVDLYLRKDEAVATAGWRPRLALQGCGFNIYTNYDEMSDVSNTWEKVTVSGVAGWRGVVHIYVAVRGKLSGADAFTPVWVPTLDIYADGLSVTK